MTGADRGAGEGAGARADDWAALPAPLRHAVEVSYLPGFGADDQLLVARRVAAQLAGDEDVARLDALAFLEAERFLRDRFGGPLRAYLLRRYALDDTDAEEVVEDAIAAYLRARKPPALRSPTAYLYRQARWKAVDRLRRFGRAPAPLPPAPEDRGDPDDALEAIEIAVMLDDALAALARVAPEAAAVFRDWRALDYDERALPALAARHGLSEKTIRRRLALARNYLRLHLAS